MEVMLSRGKEPDEGGVKRGKETNTGEINGGFSKEYLRIRTGNTLTRSQLLPAEVDGSCGGKAGGLSRGTPDTLLGETTEGRDSSPRGIPKKGLFFRGVQRPTGSSYIVWAREEKNKGTCF